MTGKLLNEGKEGNEKKMTALFGLPFDSAQGPAKQPEGQAMGKKTIRENQKGFFTYYLGWRLFC
ncbi:MAG: hypothetical protein P1P88_14425 [Bacteroidales bacterium]|nr:hypothetical protein [Bacteroidales bacterium]